MTESGSVELKSGGRCASAVCDTEVVVIRAPDHSVSLECGGHPMVAVGDDRTSGLELDQTFGTGTLIGKRFSHAESGLELLATKGGQGTLAVDGVALPVKGAKPLPASD